jgi:hypothetical protein
MVRQANSNDVLLFKNFNQRHFVHNTKQHKQHTLKNRHHDPPRPPASSGFKIIAECDRLTSHGGARSPQHGDAIFSSENNSFFIL